MSALPDRYLDVPVPFVAGMVALTIAAVAGCGSHSSKPVDAADIQDGAETTAIADGGPADAPFVDSAAAPAAPLDPPAKDGDPPAIELIRAITPFGGPLHVEADITDVLNGLPGPHRLQAYIDTWSDSAGRVSGSDGGWTVSARVKVQPGSSPRRV